MSEIRLQLKKATPIIVTTWILSMVTTLALVYVEPILFPRSWHEVAKFSGTGTKPENPFYASSDHWRILWFASPDPLTEDTSFWFWMFKSGNIFPPHFDSGTFTASDFEKQFFNQLAGVEYITGTGSFIIDVMAESASWEIIVEVYY